MKTSYDVVIVGAGHGGHSVASTLVAEGFTGSLLLLSEEGVLPHERPPLSKGFLRSGDSSDAPLFRRREYYADNGIDLKYGASFRVTALDTSAKTTTLASGVKVAYQRLVLAMGATARTLRVPGSQLTNILTVRSLADSIALRAKLSTAKSVVVIGGGSLGLEIASAARTFGTSVEVIESLPHLMARAVSVLVAEFFLAQHREQGTKVHLSSSVEAFVGDPQGRVSGVRTRDGKALAADLVIVAIGATPVVGVAQQAGLQVADALIVDEQLQTSDPSVLAVGDGVRFPSPSHDTFMRLESVQSAESQGSRVAKRLAGHGASSPEVPWFWTEQAGHRLQMVGWPGDHHETILRTSGDPTRFTAFTFRERLLVGAESVNSEGDHVAIRRLLLGGGTITRSQAADPDFDLRRHVKANLKR